MDDLNKLLEGKRVLVTGGGANIVRATVLEMAKHGATVYFAELDLSRVTEVEAELQRRSLKGKGFVVDISREDEINRLHTRLCEEGIAIDILVNNVGMEFGDDRETVGMWERWQTTFNINVIGPRYLT